MTRNADHVLLRSLNLVALGLFIYIRPSLISRLREFDSASVKTGLMGTAANKGGIAMRFKIDDSTFVFVTAHFAAGQSVVDDRNRDYWTITGNVKFNNMRILDHDNIFWFGDFNYRLNTDNETARSLIKTKNYEKLLLMDQLSAEMKAGRVFVGFKEKQIQFDPTYKYDPMSTTYDTSEKMRVPSWTDRILFKGQGITPKEYSRGEQLMSDHRPGKYFNSQVCI